MRKTITEIDLQLLEERIAEKNRLRTTVTYPVPTFSEIKLAGKKVKVANNFSLVQYPSGSTIFIKPLSVNRAWKGRRFRTKEYDAYELAVTNLLPKKINLPSPPYQIHYKFGFSSASSDFDNPVKLFTDILSKKYKFNDKLIKRCIIDVEKVKKKGEFIEFNITSLSSDNK